MCSPILVATSSSGHVARSSTYLSPCRRFSVISKRRSKLSVVLSSRGTFFDSLTSSGSLHPDCQCQPPMASQPTNSTNDTAFESSSSVTSSHSHRATVTSCRAFLRRSTASGKTTHTQFSPEDYHLVRPSLAIMATITDPPPLGPPRNRIYHLNVSCLCRYWGCGL